MTALPAGEIVLTRLDDGHIRIDRADPRVLISAELLRRIEHPDVTVKWKAPGGPLLTIRADNQTAIYRIAEYVPGIDGYIGEWVD